MHCVCVANDICTFLVWPSRYSSLSCFRDLIATTVFVPKLGVMLRGKVVHGSINHEVPISGCPECSEKMVKSGIVDKLQVEPARHKSLRYKGGSG